MSKIGVGIGEEFPADDTKPAEAPGESDRGDRRTDDTHSCGPCSETQYEAYREARRQWREQRREWRRQWRDAWRAHKRAFRAQLRQRLYEKYGDYGLYDTHPRDWDGPSPPASGSPSP